MYSPGTERCRRYAMDTTLLLVILSLALVLLRWLWAMLSRTLPLPPGPKRYPIIGSLLHAPLSMPWKTFHEWSKTYGDVIYMKIPKQTTVILGSFQAASDLLDKRSDIYSDRNHTVMNELMSFDNWDFPLMKYSPLWRSHRREFHQFFNQHQAPRYQPVQLRECRTFLRRVFDDPSQLNQYIRLMFAAIILKITYDIDVADANDEYLRLASDVVEKTTEAQLPGRFWIEFVPFLKHLPSWVPGAEFKRFVNEMNPKIEQMLNQPWDGVKRSIASGKAGYSIAATLIRKVQEDKEDVRFERERLARDVTGLAYATGADTTSAAVQSFFVAMSLYPDVQRKAQDELSRVVGPDRLPDFDDYESLVYIQAVVLETMRWLPVAPLAIPHRLMRDDEYRGMLIPRGSTVIANTWAILHDSEDYPDPGCFNPDRFIKDGLVDTNVRNPLTVAFGYGRRTCPGRWMSSASLFITIASTLQVMNIKPILGPNGERFDPDKHVFPGIKLSFDSLPCTVTPRSSKAELLVHQSFDY